MNKEQSPFPFHINQSHNYGMDLVNKHNAEGKSNPIDEANRTLAEEVTTAGLGKLLYKLNNINHMLKVKYEEVIKACDIRIGQLTEDNQRLVKSVEELQNELFILKHTNG